MRSKQIRHCMGSPQQQFFQVWWVRVQDPLALRRPVRGQARVGGASGAQIRRRPVHSLQVLTSANAEQTSFYSDDEHFLAAGQLIEANYEFSLLQETPLPATLPLFATGLGALGLMARRRKRRTAVPKPFGSVSIGGI